MLKALVPISGDIAPMVYVMIRFIKSLTLNPTSQMKKFFQFVRKIENTVSSSEEPKENFQANDDIVGAAVYQYGDNIVVEFEGNTGYMNTIITQTLTETQTGMTHSPITKLLVKKYQNKTPQQTE